MTAQNSACLAATNAISAASQIVPALVSGSVITRAMLNRAMVEAFGGTSAQGCWSQRDSFQMLEIAVLLALREIPVPADPTAAIQFLGDLESRLPTQTVRSEAQISLQHFSTPLALAWLAAYLADIGAGDHVLEPSAGTGMLAQWSQRATALHLNEMDPIRQKILQHLFPTARVTGFDAARIAGHVIERPSVVLMNPPFARNAAGQEDATAAARHLAAALGALRPNGRLVAIMPDGFALQGRRAELFQRALQGGSVTLHLRIERAFVRQGTSVPVRLLVIDKHPGPINVAVSNGAEIAGLLPVLASPPLRRPVVAERAPIQRPAETAQKARSAFAGFRARSLLLPGTGNALTVSNDSVPLNYKLRDTIADTDRAVGVYVAYRPQQLIFHDAADHPTPLVESAAMASVALPVPRYPVFADSRAESRVLTFFAVVKYLNLLFCDG